MDTKEHGKDVKENLDSRSKEAKNWKSEGQKRRIVRKEFRRLLNVFGVGALMAQKRSMESRKREHAAGQRCIASGRRRRRQRVQRSMHKDKFLSS